MIFLECIGSRASFSAESSKSCFLHFMEAGCFLIYIINRKGEMLEWLKRHAWKACKPLKGFAGSNPALSAERAGQKWSANGQKATNQ